MHPPQKLAGETGAMTVVRRNQDGNESVHLSTSIQVHTLNFGYDHIQIQVQRFQPRFCPSLLPPKKCFYDTSSGIMRKKIGSLYDVNMII